MAIMIFSSNSPPNKKTLDRKIAINIDFVEPFFVSGVALVQ
jgi:hypothetical protein